MHATPHLYIAVYMLPDHVGNELIDHHDGYVVPVREFLKGVLDLFH